MGSKERQEKMKLFNKETQPKVEDPKAEKHKQDSSEVEKLKKKNKKLEDEIDNLLSKINDLANRIDYLKIEDNERWDYVENKLRNHVDSKAPKWIEEHIDMAKIEDKVLLKVVKATFNNYKEEKGE